MSDIAQAEVTRESLLEAIQHLEDAVDQWSRIDDASLWTAFGGRTVRAISSQVEVAFETLISAVDTDHIDRQAWPIALAIDTFAAVWDEYLASQRTTPGQVDPGGTPAVWHALDEIKDAAVERRNRQPEPIRQLVAEKQPREYIARVYRWFLEDGRTPDVHRVQEELTSPGTHYDPATWVHPRFAGYWQDIEQRWQDREKRGSKGSRGSTNGKQKKARPPAAESLEELLGMPNITAAQIAKMKQIPLEEVHKRAAELSIPLEDSGGTYNSYREAQEVAAQKRRERIQRAMELERLNSYPELGDDRDARILAMYSDGVESRDIAQALRDAFPEITYQDVGTLVREDVSSTTRGNS